MDKIKTTAVKLKNHLGRNKGAYIMGTAAVLAITLQQSNRIAFYKFLTERGIDPMEYYNPEYFAELNP